MNEVFGMKTSFIAYLLLVYDKCRLVVKNIFLVDITLKFLNVDLIHWYEIGVEKSSARVD